LLRAAVRGGVGAGLAALIYQTSRVIGARGRRLRAATATAEMRRDPRPPVLYFRSFEDDKVSYFNFNSSFEEDLAAVFRDVGPVVAIARPDESLPPIGAARLRLDNDKWQEAVTGLLHRAAVVLIRPGLSPGILWEVNATIQLVPPERLLIAIPGFEEAAKKNGGREERYAAFRALANKAFPVPLPEAIGDAAFISFDANWVPRFSGTVSQPSLGYSPRRQMRAALQPFFERLGVPVRKRRWEVSPQVIAMGLILAFNQVVYNAGPDWKPFMPPGGGFSARLPGAVEETQERLSSPAGAIVMHLAQARWKGAQYMVVYADYPQSFLESRTADEILNHARDGALQNSKGRALRETPITLAGNSGRDLVVEVKTEKVLMKSRVFLVGHRLVELIVALPEDQEYPLQNSTDVQTFFDSLQLKP